MEDVFHAQEPERGCFISYWHISLDRIVSKYTGRFFYNFVLDIQHVPGHPAATGLADRIRDWFYSRQDVPKLTAKEKFYA